MALSAELNAGCPLLVTGYAMLQDSDVFTRASRV